MKLSKFKQLVEDTIEEAMANTDVTMPDDPEIVFSLGTPTNNKLLHAQGMGIAGNMNEAPCFFIDFSPAVNPVADLYEMLKGSLGAKRATEIMKSARDTMIKKAKEPSTNSKVDA